MSLTRIFLRNRYAVWALVVATVIFGVVAYRQIPVRLFPDTAPPLVNVVTSWPGATAADIDRDLTDVLATEFAALDAIATSRSTSQDNISVIQLEFHYGTNVQLAAVDVQNAISRIGDDLPSSAQLPRVMTFSTTDRPVYTVGVVADDLLSARRLAEDVVAPRIQSVQGVAAVDVFGGHVPTVFVDVNPQLAEAHHVSLPQVAAAVKASNVSLPAGRVRASASETMLRVDQRAQRIDQLEDVTLLLPDGGQLRVGAVAQVSRGAEQDDSWFGINGQRAIAVQVYRSQDANTVDVVTNVEDVVAQFGSEFPGFTFVPGEESASFTEQSVSNLLGNVWQALLLASVILFLFLGRARAALVTAFAMPLSFGLTFAAMWQLGMEFNMVTLSAVILAVGMVVDASVVVLENIMRLRAEGKSPADAASDGTDQVSLPVLAGTATTLVVLVPLLGLPGFIGKVFGPLAATLLIALTSSVLVALILVPILSLQVRDGGRIEAVASALSRPFRDAMDGLRNGYLRVLNFGLRWRLLIMIGALASFVGGVAGMRSVGMNLLPRMDGGTFTVSIETPSGTSLAETTLVVRQIERILAEQSEVILVQSQAGFESGMKFTGGSGVMGPTQGFLSVSLTPRTDRDRSIWEIERMLRAEIHKIPGIINVVVKEVGNTAKPTTLAPVVARITGPDPLVLERLGNETVQALSGVNALVAPTPTWRRDMRRVLIKVDERQTAALGQTAQSLAQQLAMGTEGIPAGTWTPHQAPSEPVKVRFSRSSEPDVAELLSWPIFLPESGEIVPLRTVAEAHTIIEQDLVTSVDLGPVLDIRAGVDGRPLNFVVADAEAALATIVVPQGYQVTIDGENKDLAESQSSILSALAISVFAVYLLLVAQFRSWLHPITVMMAVPLSISGVALALGMTSKPVSMPVMVGLVLLVGTVVNNSILLIHVIRKLRERGVERREAIRQGVRTRFRPIMMTSLSTVIGMLPLAMELALGAERFSPLAIAVIGGLLISTLLTMIVIPVLYDVAESIRTPRRVPRAKAIATALVIAALAFPASARAGKLTLDQAWKMTQNHPAATAADSRVDAAQARKRAAKARLFPKAELVARATQLSHVDPAIIEIPLTLPDGSTPDPIQLGESIKQQYSVGVAVTQPLYAGGALMAGRRAATAGVHAAEAERDVTEAALWFSLVQAWYGLAVADEIVHVHAAVVRSARNREAKLTRLAEKGRATKLELSAVALKRAEAEQRLAEAQAAAVVASLVLESLVGQRVEQADVDVVASARALAAVSATVGRSATVRAAQARADMAAAQADAKRGSLLPSLGLQVSGEYANPNTRYFPLRSDWNSSWQASVLLTWTLDSGVRSNETRSAKLEAAAARSELHALERQTQIELGKAQTSVDLAPRQLDVAATRVQVATRAVRAAETALAQGRTTVDELMKREADMGLARAVELKAALESITAVQRARTLTGHYGPAAPVHNK